MTYEEIKQHLASQSQDKPRRHNQNEEHRIQCECVRWFRFAHPHYTHSLFAVPNGGRRDKVTAGKLKAEGVLPGVSDLILLIPNSQHHALLIEMKTRTGSQQSTQKAWQKAMESWGYKYVVCRSFDDFRREIDDYIGDLHLNIINSLPDL